MAIDIEISDAFEIGFMYVREIDQDNCKTDLMLYFRIKSAPSWLKRLRGEIRLSRQQALEVEGIFLKYGVQPENVWGRYEH